MTDMETAPTDLTPALGANEPLALFDTVRLGQT